MYNIDVLNKRCSTIKRPVNVDVQNTPRNISYSQVNATMLRSEKLRCQKQWLKNMCLRNMTPALHLVNTDAKQTSWSLVGCIFVRNRTALGEGKRKTYPNMCAPLCETKLHTSNVPVNTPHIKISHKNSLVQISTQQALGWGCSEVKRVRPDQFKEFGSLPKRRDRIAILCSSRFLATGTYIIQDDA